MKFKYRKNSKIFGGISAIWALYIFFFLMANMVSGTRGSHVSPEKKCLQHALKSGIFIYLYSRWANCRFLHQAESIVIIGFQWPLSNNCVVFIAVFEFPIILFTAGNQAHLTLL